MYPELRKKQVLKIDGILVFDVTLLNAISWPHRPLIANIHADLFELAQRITATLFALSKHCFLVNMLGSIFFDLVANACWESAPRWRLGVTTCNWARKKKIFLSSGHAVMLNLSFFWLSCLSSKKKKKSRAEVTLHERSPCLIFEGKHDTEPWPRYTSKQQTKGARIHLLLTPPPRLAGFHGRDRRPLPPHRVMSLVS